jgi:hypothetical protein
VRAGEKFIAIKLVVFLSFWQGVGIAVLVRETSTRVYVAIALARPQSVMGVITGFGEFSAQEVTDGLQVS